MTREMPSIGYIFNNGMPNQDASAIQTAKMCEGFEKIGCDTILWSSERELMSDEMRSRSITEFYGLSEYVEERTLPYFDAHPIAKRVGARVAKPLLLFGNLSFVLIALHAALSSDADYYMTREWPVAVTFTLLGLPTIYTAHSLDSLGFTPRARRILPYVGRRENLKVVIAITETIAEGLVDFGVPREKIIVLPTGVDLSDYTDPIDKRETRAQTKLPPEEHLVLYTGSLLEPKGAFVAADASDHVPGKVVLLGGKERHQQQLREYADRNNLTDLIIAGRVEPSKVPMYQYAADTLLIPPLDENRKQRHQADYTSPLKLFEYMAAERPIIASDIPVLREVLTDRENALMVEPGSAEAIGDAATRLVTNPKLGERISARAKADVEQYSFEERARNIIAALD